MNLYLTIEKRHSEKKNNDYVTGVLHVDSTEKFITLDKETVMILLDLKPTDYYNLPVGYKSPKIKLVVE